MQRAAAVTAMLWALTPGAGQALTPEEAVRQVWARFETECVLALTDTQAYLRMMQTDYRTVSVNASPDGGQYSVSASLPLGAGTFIDNGFEHFGTDGLSQTSCDVHYYDAGGALGDAGAMDAAFRAEAVRRGVLSMSGGEVASHDSTSDGMLGAGPEFQSFGYALTGPIGPGYLTTASASGGEFFLNVTFTAPSRHPRTPPAFPAGARSPVAPVAGSAPAPAGASPAAPSFDEAVRINLALATRLCLQSQGNHLAAITAFQAAGFTYRPMPEANGDVWHRFLAPAETLRAEILQGQMAPSCDIHTNHLAPRDAAPLMQVILDQAAPGRFRALAPFQGTCAIFTDNGMPLPTMVTVAATDRTTGCPAVGSTFISIFKDV